MYKNSKTIIPYPDIDYEIREIIQLLNEIDGIETIDSCVGHGKYPCQICFKCEDITVLNKLLHYCFNHERGWVIYLDMGDPDKTWKDLHFILQTKDITNEYFVGLMVNNLTNKLHKYIENIKEKSI